MRILYLYLALLMCMPIVYAETFTVTSIEDEEGGFAGDGICSTPYIGGAPCTLRAAIEESNNFAGKDTIVLDGSATYVLDRQGNKEYFAKTGDLNIYDDLEIIGNGATIDSQTLDRVFHIERANVTIRDLTILNGNVAGEGAGIVGIRANIELINVTLKDNVSESYGGAIFIGAGSLNISGSELSSNSAIQGGAITAVESSIVIDTSQLNDNYADMAGAIFASDSSELQISNTDFNRNRSSMMGGAVYIKGFEDAEDVVVSETGNTDVEFNMFNVNFVENASNSGAGGAIFIDHLLSAVYETTLSIDVCTFQDNEAFGGGAIWVNSGQLNLSNCSFDSNRALSNNSWGGAIYTKEPMNISSTSFTNNFSRNNGGAIFADNNLTLTSVTATNNVSNNEDIEEGIFITSELSFDTDTDNDGVTDLEEEFNGTNPNLADSDGDGVDDNIDNCGMKSNPDQMNTGGVRRDIDKYGDACQCGDVNNDNKIDNADRVIIIRHAAGRPPGVDPDRCDVDGDGLCDRADADLIRDFLLGKFIGDLQRCADAFDPPEI